MWPLDNVLMSFKLNFMGFVECTEEIGRKIQVGIGFPKDTNNRIKYDTGVETRIAIITGGNTGIGFATSSRLITQGCNVVLACRDPEKAELAADQLRSLKPLPGHSLGNVQIEKLDLASLKSVKKFIKSVKEKFPRLHILICNAGIMAPPQRLETEDSLELQFQTNYLGHWMIAQELIKHQRQQRCLNSNKSSRITKRAHVDNQHAQQLHDDNGGSLQSFRVVMLSSLTHLAGDIDFTDLQAKKSYHPFKQYAATKLMTLITAKELQRRFQLHHHRRRHLNTATTTMTSATRTVAGNVGVNGKSRISSLDDNDDNNNNNNNDCAVAVHPGIVDTDLARTYFFNQVPKLLRPLARPLFEHILFPICLKSPETAAESVLYAATMPGIGGEYIVDCKPSNRWSALAGNEALARRLWQVSEELTGIDAESW